MPSPVGTRYAAWDIFDTMDLAKQKSGAIWCRNATRTKIFDGVLASPRHLNVVNGRGTTTIFWASSGDMPQANSPYYALREIFHLQVW
jgi:hypothetical protein